MYYRKKASRTVRQISGIVGMLLGLSVSSTVLSHPGPAAHFKPGDKLQTLTNLHPIKKNGAIYTLNYQQNGLIPACADIEITRASKNKIVFRWEGNDYVLAYDKHTRKSRVSFHDSLDYFFAEECDSKKIETLREVDKLGVKDGKPRRNMSKYGILFAMGRPPHHANPDLGARKWTYWKSKHNRMAIEFSEDGFVTRVRD